MRTAAASSEDQLSCGSCCQVERDALLLLEEPEEEFTEEQLNERRATSARFVELCFNNQLQDPAEIPVPKKPRLSSYHNLQ